MFVTIELKADEGCEVCLNDIERNIEAQKRAIEVAPESHERVLLEDTLTILEALKDEIGLKMAKELKDKLASIY